MLIYDMNNIIIWDEEIVLGTRGVQIDGEIQVNGV
jgi:hypothetical protein